MPHPDGTAAPTLSGELDRCITELAVRLADRVPDAVALIEETLRVDIPELITDARDEAQIALLHDAIQGNVETILYSLRHTSAVEDVRAPIAAITHTRRLAQQDVPLNALIRGYRVGQRQLTHVVFDELHGIDVTPESRISMVEAITEKLFSYVDWMTLQIIATYEDERERWLESNNSLRAMRVREILGAGNADIDRATTTLRYPLHWHHVGLILWYPTASANTDDLSRLHRIVRDLAAAVGADAAPLFVATDRASGWTWLPFQSSPPDVVDTVRRFAEACPHAPNMTIGSPAMGIEGFRRTHQQADEAKAVALANGNRDVIALAASDPGLAAAALLGDNLDKARGWVAEVLGRLANPTDSDAQLRETLRIFLSCGASYKLAAEQLIVHHNTVKYRVARALERRGRPIHADRLDVELALLLCRWYGDAVLAQGAGRQISCD